LDADVVVTTEGDLARAALNMLAADPDHRPAVEAQLAGASPARFALAEIAITTAALTVLASGVDFSIQKDVQGRVTWSSHFHKPEIEAHTKPLVAKLCSYLGPAG
jgi:hypothetical protein